MKRIYDEGIQKFNNQSLPIVCKSMTRERQMVPSGEVFQWETLHYHKYIELLYTIEGCFEVYVNGNVLPMPKGNMVVINAGELHAARAMDSKNTEICIRFLPDVLFSFEQTIHKLEYSIPYVIEHFGCRRCFESELLETTFLPEAFAHVQHEQQEKSYGYELAIRAEVMRIFTWIIRLWHSEINGKDIPSKQENEIIHKAKEYIREHYADVTLKEAADYCCLSYSYFSRLFMRCVKMRFSQYVNLIRINESMKALALTNKSITEIALSYGFSSTSYYIQTFRQLKHTSPSQFRKNFRNESEI